MTPKKKATSSPTTRKSAPQREVTLHSPRTPEVSRNPDPASPQASAAVEPRRPVAGTSGEEIRRRIAETAYRLFQQRGGEHGHALEDWLRAERQVEEERRRERGS